MTRPDRPATSLLPSLLVVCLALAGLAQGVSLMLQTLDPEGLALLQRGGVVPMWALWLSVALSVVASNVAVWARMVVVLCSAIGVVFRGVMVCLAWPAAEQVGRNHGVALVIDLTAAFVVAVVLTVWAAWDVALVRREFTTPRIRQDGSVPLLLPLQGNTPSAPLNGSVTSAASTASPDVPLSPHPERAEHPESALTPVGLERSRFGKASTPPDGWRQVSSPWPRAVEDDPDGTLLRPPRRRVHSQRR
ncbi:hypothetical protein [uncultured Tessaracoccus sp.]|uniref:hypothetical protein n=1 Tax=uncultured Tessaracoccus sp. TaxID=905023 RepID=UPI002623BFE6|nr:hypothetical protein [uncultured Tessaracoccus sp.]